MTATVRLRSIPLAIAIGFPLAVAVVDAGAIGFGPIVNATHLGQPLDFAAVVQLGSDESLARECVDAEVVSGDTRLQRGQLRVTLEPGAEPNSRSLRVTTFTPIDEPVVTVNVTLGCNDKVSRKFVAFVDPPAFDAARTASAEALPLVPQRVDSQVAPLLAIVAPDAEAAMSRAAVATTRRSSAAAATDTAPRFAGASPRLSVATTNSPRRGRSNRAGAAETGDAGPASASTPATPRPRRAPDTRVAAAAPARSGGTLRLDAAPIARADDRPAATQAATAADPASSPARATVPPAPLGVAAATAAAMPAVTLAVSPDALRQERERVRRLEDGLARLAADAGRTRETLDRLQARLDAAEKQRYANPLVYGLAAFSGLALIAIGGLGWRRKRSAAGRAWWQPPAGMTRSPTPTVAAPLLTRTDAASAAAVAAEADVFGVEPAVDGLATAVGADGVTGTRPAPPTPSPDTMPMPTTEIAVEELIDLEQQADFFVVLGQDDAAVDLLASHLRSHGGISPLPYLKLLEIHRRRDEHEAYERVRGRFNRRFNTHAPAWDLDLQLGRDLDAYPDTLLRLQTLWSRPPDAMKALDTALFRRGDDSPTFDLPAYRELLLLYSVARDLAEPTAASVAGDAGSVDLLLPLDPPRATTVDLALEPVVGVLTPPTQPLDLDVSLPPAPPARPTATPPVLAMTVEEFDTRAALLEFGESATRPRELARAES